MNVFFCPICESELEFIKIVPKEHNYNCSCRCEICRISAKGPTPSIAYLEFLRAIPVQFFLEKLTDKLDTIDSSLMCINTKGETPCN